MGNKSPHPHMGDDTQNTLENSTLHNPLSITGPTKLGYFQSKAEAMTLDRTTRTQNSRLTSDMGPPANFLPTFPSEAMQQIFPHRTVCGTRDPLGELITSFHPPSAFSSLFFGGAFPGLGRCLSNLSAGCPEESPTESVPSDQIHFLSRSADAPSLSRCSCRVACLAGPSPPGAYTRVSPLSKFAPCLPTQFSSS